MTIELLGGFLLVVIVLNITPGPDMAYILSRAIAQGTPAGIVSAAGVSVGALFHVFFATIVFALAAHISAMAFAMLLIAGACYLIFLGVSALREKAELIEILPLNDRKAMKRIFLDGVVVDLLNPKVAVFFLALLPTFISKDTSNSVLWFLMLGILVVVLSFLIEWILVLACDRVRDLFSSSEKKQIVLHRTMGIVFILLGVFAFFSVNFEVIL